MFKRFAVGLAVVCGLALQACSPKNQDECGFVQNVYGERISWKGNIPVVMQLHKDLPEQYATAVMAAAETWNQNIGRKVIEIKTERFDGPAEAQKDGLNVIYFYSGWEADRPNEQARTSVYWVGDLIKEADIRVNDHNFDFYWNQNEKTGEVNIESLLVHEMGHVLGLKHKDQGSSVMATYLASNTKRIQLAETDRKSLKCEY